MKITPMTVSEARNWLENPYIVTANGVTYICFSDEAYEKVLEVVA